MPTMHYHKNCNILKHLTNEILPNWDADSQSDGQKQQPDVFYKKGCSYNFAILLENTCVGVSL